MSTKYLKNGNSFMPTSDAALNIHDKLPVGNFIVAATPRGELYFDTIGPFDIPVKLYGETTNQADRILTTFRDRSNSTGVLLAGEKGSGKTLLAKTISEMGKAEGMPTIVVNAGFSGDEFNKLIQNIEQPCIVLFDEFEKVYDRQEQEQILTLLDGVYTTKKLFIITCNDVYKLDRNLTNRPGRIFYMLTYAGLDLKFVQEYCMDNLNNKDHIDLVVKIASAFENFNFDILKAIVEEMNRYNETPYEALKMLNASPAHEVGTYYDISLSIKNVTADYVHESNTHSSYVQWNPVTRAEYKIYYERGKKDATLTFDSKMITTIDPVEGIVVYDDGKGNVLTFTKRKPRIASWEHMVAV